jgi:glyoxylase-like metal-dependent hydrolase (beta-lactamase superfamily II)
MTSVPSSDGLSRRRVLRTAVTASAAGTAALLGSTPAFAAPTRSAGARRLPPDRTELTGALNQQSAVRTLRVGDTRFTYIVDGAMELSATGFFPAIPADYWAAHPEALTADGGIAASVGGVLVERGRRKLLIDVGLGANVLSPAFGRSQGGALLSTLRRLDVDPCEIDTVAFTHLHTDHTGVGFTPDRHGELRRAFPRAVYRVAALEWEPFWLKEVPLGAPSWNGFMVPMSGIRQTFGDGEEVWPGTTTLITPGHSPGHTTYAVSTSDGRRVLVLGDAFHTPAQITHPDWSSHPDVDVADVLHARTRLLGELAKPRTLGFAFHFGDRAFGRTVTDPAGQVQWEPVPARRLLPPPIELSDV